jgi:putative intracellular protease/amidase
MIDAPMTSERTNRGHAGDMTSKRIVIVVTAHDTLGPAGQKTGFYLNEVAVPYVAFTEGGYDVDIASIPGGPVPADPKSLKAADVAGSPSAAFTSDPDAQAKITDTRKVADLDPSDYQAVWVAGGHGAMWDLPEDPDLAHLIGALFDAGQVVSAVCHGPAGLVGARRADGESILAGRRATGFLDAEERAVELTNVVPFLLEERMRKLGADFVGQRLWADNAVRDGNLVTGQNPKSSTSTARLVLEALSE